jgi:phospholipid N-methyltransferase
MGLQQADCIVSGLPFTSLPRPVTHVILQATRAALGTGGVFVTYQYTPVLRSLLRSYFPTTKIARFVLPNIPPALVFVCRKLS